MKSQLFSRELSLRELQQIPGIGESLSSDLYSIGIHHIIDLKNQDPEKLFQKLNQQAGYIVDRCVLYTFRCAVYFASHKTHDPKLLKWWNWKD